MFTNNLKAVQYITGGQAVVTFLNHETGNRFTYRIIRANIPDKNIWYVKVLSRPDNSAEQSYQYIGYIWNDSDNNLLNSYLFMSGKKGNPNCQAFKVFKYVLNKLLLNTLPVQIEVYHEGVCGSCGRRLTVPESIDSGFGPVCIKKL